MYSLPYKFFNLSLASYILFHDRGMHPKYCVTFIDIYYVFQRSSSFARPYAHSHTRTVKRPPYHVHTDLGTWEEDVILDLWSWYLHFIFCWSFQAFLVAVLHRASGSAFIKCLSFRSSSWPFTWLVSSSCKWEWDKYSKSFPTWCFFDTLLFFFVVVTW